MKIPGSGGGWQAVAYTLRTARKVGFLNLWRAMRTKNTCKTCALGMGGQQGGMRNEKGHFPEFCKKSLQAMAADMQGRIEGRFFEKYSLAQMAAFSPREMEMMGRLTWPLYAEEGDTHYRPILWDEALGMIAGKLKEISPREAFFYSSGRSSNEAGFLLQLFARVYGTNHVNNCSYYCHQASGVGLGESIGQGTATIELEDLEHCDLFFLIGGNPASNHPRLMSSLMRLRRRGGRVIVINPAREPGLVNFKVPSDVRSMLFGTEMSSLYLQPVIGGDIALLSGITKCLLERDQVDHDYVAQHTENFEQVRRQVELLSWEEIQKASGVSRAEIEEAAEIYAQAKNAVFGWTMGITHHEHGVENVQWIVNVALLRGMVGKPHAGLLPIRGHSNVQGLGSIGVTPALKKAVMERLTTLGVKMPGFEGYDTMAAMHASDRGEMKFGLCLGGNLYGANPDSTFAGRALSKLDLLVYVSTTLNIGHARGRGKATLILPALARDEEPQPTTQESMFNFVRLSDGGASRHAGPRSEISILSDMALRACGEGGPVDWRLAADHSHLRQLIAQIIPGWEKIGAIDTTKEEFHLAERILHRRAFKTASGKAIFKAHAIPQLAGLEKDQVRVMTVRSEGQFNTVVYEEEDIYRGQDGRDVILMNREDMARMGLKEDQRVTVSNEVGSMAGIRVRPFEIRAGNALMYYPEANALVSTKVDPRSKTPGFKSAVVRVEPGVMGQTSGVEVTISVGKERRERAPMKAC
ncbi:MAG TPA: FdhF/YdeP family oxidoreductase [Tepidisphaeraceae bacterium]|nr:FdhF/YdeP family oxidoreductase [Tepidisphaeraceae bacterium]